MFLRYFVPIAPASAPSREPSNPESRWFSGGPKKKRSELKSKPGLGAPTALQGRAARHASTRRSRRDLFPRFLCSARRAVVRARKRSGSRFSTLEGRWRPDAGAGRQLPRVRQPARDMATQREGAGARLQYT